jgi:hypothetical protein
MSGLLPHRRKAFRQVAPANFDGFGNKSRSFNGVDDYVSIPDNADIPTGAQTWACWVRFDDDNTFRDLMLHWSGTASNASFALTRNTDNKLRLYVDPDGLSTTANTFVASSTSLVKGNWYHVAGVFIPSTSMTVYVDGSEDGQITSGIPAQAFDATVPLTLGGRDDQPSLRLEGNLADCRIYDTDLSSTEIADLYAGTNITTNLVGHWLKDTDDVLDHSVNPNNGENFGSIFSPDNPSPAVEFGRASRAFDGISDRIEIADINDHSFGDGVNDSPFSVSAWIKIEATNKAFRVLSKWSDSSGPEWAFTTDSSDRLALFLKDVSSNANIKRYYSTSLSSYLNQWVHVSATYDGRGGGNAGDGIDLYLNGVNVDDSNGNSGTYVAMENRNTPTYIGVVQLSSGYSLSKGKIADVRLYDTDLSASDISDLYNGTDVQTNLIGHWLTDNDDVEDKAGTNDGTNFGSTYSYDAPLPANKLIDTYASACGAYSLRELTTAWAGQNVVDVRRVSDGSIISLTSAEITDGTLASFCGTLGGYVSKVYDQSGNGFDLIQPTGNQPRIYRGTTQTISTLNGLPCLEFFGGAYLYNTNSFDYEGGVSWYSVVKIDTLGGTQRIWCDDIIGVNGFISFLSDGSYFLNDGVGYKSHTFSGEATTQQLKSYNFDESQGSYVYGFDGSYTSGSFGTWAGSIETSGSSNIGVMGAGNGTQTASGLWQELIVYPNDQLHNKENIERNINEFYSIY